MRRASTDVSGLARPVSFATKFPRINPGASGVAVLEHLERLDAVEAGLMRLGEDDALPEEEEDEGDLGESSRQPGPSKVSNVDTPAAQGQQAATSPIEDDEDEAADTVGELSLSVGNLDDGETEDGDLGQMTQSLPYLGSPQRVRWASERSVLSERGVQRESLDWLSADSEGGTKMKTVIVEVR
jgi:phosphatidylinositol 4-kinase type 2